MIYAHVTKTNLIRSRFNTPINQIHNILKSWNISTDKGFSVTCMFWTALNIQNKSLLCVIVIDLVHGNRTELK